MQTDDTLDFSDNNFAKLEQEELEKAGFTAKPKETLSMENSLQFNGCTLKLIGDAMVLQQKEQGKKIQLIDYDTDFCQAYTEQRA